MKKQILILIAVAISVSLITSGTCSGPIDEIFIGWRDTTACNVDGWGCFGGTNGGNATRETGVFVLFFLLIFTLLIYGLFKSFYWLWQNTTAKQVETTSEQHETLKDD